MVARQQFPELVRSHIRSVWALELLLMLRRDPVRAWLPADLTRELRATGAIVQSNLEGFERSGLVMRTDEGRFAFAPASPLLEDFAATLEAQYRERPVTIINLIAAPEDKIQQLADAFRFKTGERK